MDARALLAVGCLVIAGCSGTEIREAAPEPTVASKTASPGPEPSPEPIAAPSPSPTGMPELTTSGPEPTVEDLSSLVLDATDLLEWNQVLWGPSEQPVPETQTDCALLDDLPIDRYGGWEGVFVLDAKIVLRNTASRFPSVEEAVVFVEMIKALPLVCPTVTEADDSTVSSLEPLDVPEALDQSAGLSLASDDSLRLLAVHRRGDAVAVLDVRSEEADDAGLRRVFEEVALLYSISLRGPFDQPTPRPTATPFDPRPTPTPTWSEHPFAAVMPEAADLGPGWERDRVWWREARPADFEDDVPGCDATTPPTLDALRAAFEHLATGATVELGLESGIAADVDATMAAIRAIAGCGSIRDEDVDIVWAIEPLEVGHLAGADSVVGMRVAGSDLVTQAQSELLLIFARNGERVITVFAGNPENVEAGLPTVDELLAVVELAASRLP